MADGIVTLKERHRRTMERMERALVAIDVALLAYAREHGGRFIRFGSTAEGRMRDHSDVDIIADFPGEASLAAASFAEDVCFANGMTPDTHPGAYLSPAFKAESERRGLVISMMAARWADVERSLARSRRHFALAIEAFAEVRSASSDKERYFRRAAFMHAMLAGYTSFENAMKDLTGLLEEPLPAGHDWHKTLVDRLAAPVAGQRPAVLDDERLLIAIDALRGFWHVAARAYDRFDDERAAVATRKAEVFLAEIGPALARFRAAIDPD